MDVAAWLHGLGLERYEQAFRDAAIDADVVPELTDSDLEKLGVLLGDRKRLLKAIAALPVATSNRAWRTADDRADWGDAERRHLTVMFVDLVGSTAMSAGLDPEDMRDVIREFQTSVAAEIEGLGGYTAKFMGDGVLAYFGWPRALENAAERAVLSALAVRDAVARQMTRHGQARACRIGIASGLVVVGDLVGEGPAQEEAVVGSAPNLAARLQGIAEPGQVVIGSRTRQRLGARFALRSLGERALKGFAEPVRAFAVIGERPLDERFQARRSTLTPMFGREQELRYLLELWSRAKQGEGQGVILVGEAGIGKSRVCRAMLDAVTNEQHVRIRHHGSQFHSNSALWPVIQQIRFAARISPNDPVNNCLDKLEALLATADCPADDAALFASMIGLDGTMRYGQLNLSPREQRAKTFEALLRQLIGLASKQPVLLVVEDAHWMDPTTLELVRHAIGRASGSAAVLTLVTTRRYEIRDLSEDVPIDRLSLKKLNEDGVGSLVQCVVGEHLATETIDEIVRRAGGIPLFAEELARAAADSEAVTLPDSLHDSLNSRLDRLPRHRRLAQIAACIGRDFSPALLASLANASESIVAAKLEELTRADLMMRRGNRTNVTYAFKHTLLREAAYDSILKRDRRDLHRRIASILRTRFSSLVDSEPELLAHHLTCAGQTAKGIKYWSRAGEAALRRFANTEAIGHFRSALRLLKDLQPSKATSKQELALQIALAIPLTMTRGYGSIEFERCTSQALAILDRIGETEHRFTVTRAAWNSSLLRRPMAGTLELGRKLLQMAEAGGDPIERSLACRAMGYALHVSGQFSASTDQLSQGIELSRGFAGPDRFEVYGEHPGIVCRSYLAQNLTLVGRFAEAIDLERQSVSMAREVAIPHVLVWALVVAAQVSAIRRDHAAAEALADEAAALANEHQLQQWIAAADAIRGCAVAGTDDTAQGIALLEGGIRRWLQTGAVLHSAYYHAVLAGLRSRSGDHDRALADIALARRHAANFGERYAQAELHRTKANILHSMQASWDEIEAEYQTALRISQAQGAGLWTLRASCELGWHWSQRGRRRDASELIAPVLDQLAGSPALPDVVEARTLLMSLR